MDKWRLVEVIGRLSTINGERAIVDATVTCLIPGWVDPIGPLGMTNKALGGGPVGRFTIGVYPDGVGCHNIGLLVTSWGRVTHVSEFDPGSFSIDDGSDLDDGSQHTGVWVSVTDLAPGNTISPPPLGSYVAVTGISSCGYGPMEPAVRILRPRNQDDIRPYTELQ